jgi:dihydrofolate synthase/folylpolyglutamate synthase
LEHDDFQSAWNAVHLALDKQDRVVAFGSFLVVSGMLEVVVPHAPQTRF